MRKTIMTMLLSLAVVTVMAQGKAVVEKMSAAGLKLDATTNMEEVEQQYKKNQAQWDKAIEWLSTHDLKGIEKGRHPIEGSTLTASVEDTQNASVENRQSESHYHHIDLQVVVRGVEGFYLLDHATSEPRDKWREDVIHYNFDVEKATFRVGHAGTAFLFFPSDWHVAKVQTPMADQTLRVIVIKLDYVE